MSNLTTFSKILILLGLATFASMLVVTCYNCTKNSNTTYTPTQSYRQPVQDYGDYQVVNNPSGQQVVVVKDNSGQEFFMNYMMFQTLMNSGGIGSVRNYYGNHRYDPDWDIQQSSYRSTTKTTINHYYGSQNVDDSKPVSDQIKYNQSKGFGSKSSTSTTTVPNTSVDNSVKSNPSKGFSGKWFESSEKTSTPAPLYKKSNGFGSTNTPTNSSSSYKPSSGFGSSKSNSSSYKPSSGFGSSSSSSYKPSSGFGSSSKSSSSSSKGFGKKN